MPIYNFKCDSCENMEEKFVHKILTEETFSCDCGGNMSRVFEGSSMTHTNNTPWRKGLSPMEQASKLSGGHNLECV